MRPSSSAGSAALLPCTLNLRTPALLPSPSSFKKLFRSSRKLRLEKEVITLRLFGSLGRPFLPPSPVSEAVLLLPLPAATLVPRLGGGKLLWTHLRDRRPAPAQSPPREGRLVSACGGRGTEYGGGGETERGRDRLSSGGSARIPPEPSSPAPHRLLLIFTHSKVCSPLKLSQEGRKLGSRRDEGAPEGAGA